MSTMAFPALLSAALAGTPARGAEATFAPAPSPTTPAALATPAGSEDCAVSEAIVAAPPAEVWRVFTTADGFKALGVANAHIDLRVGGLIRAVYDAKVSLDDERAIHNQIIAIDTGRVLVFRIQQPPKGFPFPEAWKTVSSVVTLTDLGDGRTAVRLAMCGYGADEESQKMRAFFQNGNRWVMDKLVATYAPKDTDAPVAPAAGGAHAARPLDPIEVVDVVAAPRADVFEALSSSAGWKAFLGVDSKIELRPGGVFEIYFGGTTLPEGSRGSEGCTVLSYVPGEMLSFTWNAPPTLAKARRERTWVVVTFEEVSPRATRVRLRHMGFAENAAEQRGGATGEEWAQARAYFAAAWPKVVGAVKAKFDKP